MAFPSKAVANYFLTLAAEHKQPLTPMKLQKLVYYGHGWCLGITGQPLLDEAIQAWSFGPVVRSLYNEFREFGASEITRLATKMIHIKPLKFKYSCPSLKDTIGQDVEFAEKLLKRIWEVYGEFSAVQLSNMTHAPGTPWDQVNKLYGGKIPKYATIPNELILDYFKKENAA